MKPESRKTKRRVLIACMVCLFGAPVILLYGPSLIHRLLHTFTPAAVLRAHQDEWSQIVQHEPEALNGPNREACLRYSDDAYLWFRVRGLGDPGDATWIVLREWRALFRYFFDSHTGPRPPELGGGG